MRIIVVAIMAVAAVTVQALSFEDAIARVDLIDSVRLAEIQLLIAREDVDAARYAGDWSLGVTPSAATTAGSDGIRTASVSASATLALPVGLSHDAATRLDRAGAAAAAAERALDSARTQAIAKLYALYQSAWLAQERIATLDGELELAQAEYRIANARFAEGAITLAGLTSVFETLERARTARDQGTLDWRVSWLELAFSIGLNPSDQQSLDPYPIFSADPPKPPELSAWAASHDRAVIDQRATIEAIRRDIDRSASTFSVGSTRLTVSVVDHSLSASYGFANPTLTLGYTPPSITIVAPDGPTRDPVPFGVTVSANLSWTGTGRDDLAQAAARIQLERELVRLESIQASLDFGIRSASQQVHRADDAVAQAERALETAMTNQRIVTARVEAGRAGEIDLMEAAVAVSRAEHNLTASRISRERAIMAAVMAASYFGVHYPHLAGIRGERE